jgi:hypothetical protein
MSATVDYPIVGSYNNQRVLSIDAERTINLFEYIDQKGKKAHVLLPTSGLLNTNQQFVQTTGGFRRQFIFNNNEYSVVGNGVFLINAATNVVSLLGRIGTSVGYVGIDANTFQIIIVDGLNGWIYDTTANTFLQITDTNFPKAPIDVTNLDGFFSVPQGGTPNFFLSSLNQGMVWGGFNSTYTTAFATNNFLTVSATANLATGVPVAVAVAPTGTLSAPLIGGPPQIYFAIRIDATRIALATTYANAIAGTQIVLTGDGNLVQTITVQGQLQQAAITTHPGNIVAIRTLHRFLFIFSAFFTEVWENYGAGQNLPFRRNNGLLMEYGCAAIGSVQVGFDRMFFLSQDKDGLGSVMQVTGSQSVPVSPRALDYQYSQYAGTPMVGVADCYGMLVKENGMIFYRMNFTLANATFVYNVSMSDPSSEATMLWHEEQDIYGNRHPAQTHAYFNGNNYYGNYAAPILYQVSSAYQTNDGQPIPRIRIGKPMCPPGYQRQRIDRWQIDLVQGSALEVYSETLESDLLTELGVDITTELSINIETESGQVINDQRFPVVFFSYSKDGGQSYGSETRGLMGQIGDRTARTVWRKLGVTPRGQGFVPKIRFFNQLPFVVLGAAWAMDTLPE